MKRFMASLLISILPVLNMQAAPEQTLAIIKPDAVAAQHIGEIIARYEASGLQVVALKMARLNKEKAGAFYAVHRDRPYFKDLTSFMSSGPIVAMVLNGENSIAKSRQLIGATNPKEAAKGTIRADFGKSIGENAIHGSDTLDNAKSEIAFFFTASEIFAPNSK
jgi:nucleoside-diphosphate kinase